MTPQALQTRIANGLGGTLHSGVEDDGSVRSLSKTGGYHVDNTKGPVP